MGPTYLGFDTAGFARGDIMGVCDMKGVSMLSRASSYES